MARAQKQLSRSHGQDRMSQEGYSKESYFRKKIQEQMSREAERERLYAHTSTTHNLHAHVHDDRMSKPEENEQGRRPVGEQSDLRPLAEDLSFFLEPVQESAHLLARVSRSVLTGLRVLLNTDFAASLHTQFGSKEGEQGAGAEEIMNGDGNPEEQGADSPRVWELSLGTLLGFSQLSDDEIETLLRQAVSAAREAEEKTAPMVGKRWDMSHEGDASIGSWEEEVDSEVVTAAT
ncbi:hypothetical protein DB88DRAFT_471455 [Papiliotrema laurentii]|uniref:Uncharacterized protein n=1 Tax=Papiliotrema laurentii TaxID=5418 RepID=A0AAD9FSI6_PAPLA|nr:hypothetical protein DB88DRAFT_471455 [Papiliotrema laurentii]